MNKTDILNCFVKFGEKKHMEDLFQSGELYFNIPSEYNKLQSKDNERGDDNEGGEWIVNEQIKNVKVEHPFLGTHHLLPISNERSKLIQYNNYFLSYSLLAISSRTFIDTNESQIDKRILNMEGVDTAVMITDPYRFLNSVSETLKKENLNFKFDLIEYKNLDLQGKVRLDPFVKKIDHRYQMEYRLIIANDTNCAKKITIGSIADYSYLVSAESMIESTWNAKRK